ncbi:hypothetical protein JNL27_14250 [bacterium]|nr:hypothetical protein [bacterium]
MTDFVYKDGLYRPTIKTIYIFLDDGGQREADYYGFTTLLIDEFSFQSLESQVFSLCKQFNITELHAMKLHQEGQLIDDMNTYDTFYTTILDSLASVLEKANYCYLRSILASKKIIDKVNKFHFDTLKDSSVIMRGKPLPTEILKLYQYVAFPVDQSLHKIDCDSTVSINLQVDRKDELDSTILNKKTYLSGHHVSNFYNAAELIPRLLNILIELGLKKQCKISNFSIVSDKGSPGIGVVDAIANFGFNFAKCAIKPVPSQTEQRKSDLFTHFLNRISWSTDQVTTVKSSIRNSITFENGSFHYLTDTPISVFEMKH